MNFVHLTRCVTIKDKVYPAWAPAPTTTLILVSIPVLLASLVVPYVALIEIPLLIAYCEWWLYDRLICLGGEACAIGLLGKPEPPEKKTGFDKFDTDFSINLVLAPHNIQELPVGYPASVPPPPFGTNPTEYFHEKYLEAMHHQIADDSIQGNLIREQATTRDANWDFLGYFNSVGGSMTLSTHQAYLHCEFEGGGIYKLLQMLKVLLGLATVAAIVCSIPVLGWIACAIIAGAAAIFGVAGILVALDDTGTPTVVDPRTGATTDQLHPGSDILFVAGDWVFDTAHEGWNEIHPIKRCLLVGSARYVANDRVDWDHAIGSFLVSTGKWTYDDPDPAKTTYHKKSGPPTEQDWKDWVQSYCDATGDVSSGLTTQNQGRPENTWQIHPAIDGCRP